MFENVVERQFEILTPDRRHYVRQVHYTSWPDHGVPEGNAEEFELILNELISFLLNNSNNADKVVVHCSAGIGRTGTTIALSELLISVSSQLNQHAIEPKLSVFSVVRRLRE